MSGHVIGILRRSRIGLVCNGVPVEMASFKQAQGRGTSCACQQNPLSLFGPRSRAYRPLNLQSRPQTLQRQSNRLARHVRSTRCSGTARPPSDSVSGVQTMPGSASEAVLQGQQAFDKAEYPEALQLFSRAMTLRPNEDEARAALYNGACAKAKLKDWQGAADDVIRAVNDYKLKLEVAVKVCICCRLWLLCE